MAHLVRFIKHALNHSGVQLFRRSTSQFNRKIHYWSVDLRRMVSLVIFHEMYLSFNNNGSIAVGHVLITSTESILKFYP